ncbi:MAG: Omp28 family outer membrane lipoprotein [Bacteroidetes bacterium]|nr:Omp28 family outer membrane lipoprotein [Bacteroidota bacterium]
MNFKLVSLFIAAILITGCDKVEGPFGTNGSGSQSGGDTTEQIVRKVLIEDYTGHTCGNCPRAAESLEQIHNLYGNQIVAIGVHAGFFAVPVGSSYPEDFRTEVGNELDQFFGNSSAGLPNGLVNRKSFDGLTIVQHTDWASKVSTLLNTPPEAFIRITPDFNESNRELNVEVKTTILQNIDEELKIVYYLTEDGIVAPQKDYSLEDSHIDEYNHRHVLRGSMNGAWGNVLGVGSGYVANNELITNANYTIPTEWDASNVAVVAVVYKSDSKEVVQVEEAKIQ